MAMLHMLSTSDNPYNPFEDWDRWFQWDAAAGYHTSNYLSRVLKTSDELSDADMRLAQEHAIDEICEYNLTGNMIKVSKEVVDLSTNIS